MHRYQRAAANHRAVTISRNKQFSHHDEVRPHHREAEAADVKQQDQKSAAVGDNICRGYFLPHANAVEPFLPEAEHGVCVQSVRTHLSAY